jgi:hypothetical protein
VNTPDQRARWDRRKAAFQALSKIDAGRVVALVEWLVPIAKRESATPVDEDDDDYLGKTLSVVDLTKAADDAEDYLLVQQRWDALRTQHDGTAVLNGLANALAKHIGWQVQTNWEPHGLYLLAEVLP